MSASWAETTLPPPREPPMYSCVVRARVQLAFDRVARRLLLLSALASVAARPVESQLVTPKTVPVFQDEQFALYPSSRPGLGGAYIALDDTLADPFVNPAKALRLRGLAITTAPYSHGISGSRGGGRTLPLGVLAGSGTWAVAVLAAMQELDRAGPIWNRPTSERTASNQYVSGSLARRVAPGVSVGVSGFHADLAAVDGVDLLYAGSDRIDQSGSLTDVRLGATKEWEPGHVLELLVLRNTTNMRHDVHYTTYSWEPVSHTSTMMQRQDTNLDQTNIWGAHTQYVRPVGAEGWRIGALATVNRLDHPKIPNYTLQNLPRDPGATTAFNWGMGAARSTPEFTFAVDVILEPMVSDTYADAATNVTRTNGSVIAAGDKTVENHFRFHNSKARIGIGRMWGADTASHGSFAADFSLAAYSISYDLLQTNNITGAARSQHENWVESGPTIGIRYRSRDFELSYAFRTSCGTGGCDFLSHGDFVVVTAPAESTGGIIAAPSSPLFLQSGSETSHHFMISVPIR